MPFSIGPGDPANQPIFDAVEEWLRVFPPASAKLPQTIDVDRALFGKPGYRKNRKGFDTMMDELDALLRQRGVMKRPRLTARAFQGTSNSGEFLVQTARHVLRVCTQ